MNISIRRAGSKGSHVLKTLVSLSLAFPLFYKILVANAVLITAFGYLMYQFAIGNPWELFGIQAQVPALIIVSLSVFVLVNYGILKLALQPLAILASLTVRIKNGEIETRALKPVFNDRTTNQIIQTFNDVLDELDSERKEILSLSSRITEHAEMTLKNVAQELHDHIANDLAALYLMEQSMEKSLTGNKQLEDIRVIQIRTVATMEAIRKLSAGLQPVIFDSDSLINALKQLQIDRSVLGVPIELNLTEVGQVRGDIALAAFRITQESVNNAIKHSHPGKIIVTLDREHGRLKLRVEDDGRGFQVENTISDQTGVHLGLTIMKDRASLTGGSLIIHSEEGMGTSITAYLGEL